jgi:hypothetical protein
VIFALLIAMTAVMAVVFFGLSVLLISVVGWLWPSRDLPKTALVTSAMTGATHKGKVREGIFGTVGTRGPIGRTKLIGFKL